MSRLLDARDAILTALEVAGLKAFTTGRLTAPCILVEPGDPWSGPSQLRGGGRRLTRWQLTAIAGKANSAGAYAALATLVDGVDTALLDLRDCQLPVWAQPHDYLLGSVPYAASVATIEYTV